MKKIFACAWVLLVAFSCQKMTEVEVGSPVSKDEFICSIERPDVKTVQNQANDVLWQSGDEISVFRNNGDNLRFHLKDEFSGKGSGIFSYVSSVPALPENQLDLNGYNVAVYPFTEGISVRREVLNYPDAQYTVYHFDGVTLPDHQVYRPDSFAEGCGIMAAVSTDNHLFFRNMCGFVKLQLTGTQKVKSITFNSKGNWNEPFLAGKVGIRVSEQNDYLPFIEETSQSSKEVVLDCGEGVQLDPVQPTVFTLAMCPHNFRDGFSFDITTTDGLTMTKHSYKSQDVGRSQALVMPAFELIAFDLQPETPIFNLTPNDKSIRVYFNTRKEVKLVYDPGNPDWIRELGRGYDTVKGKSYVDLNIFPINGYGSRRAQLEFSVVENYKLKTTVQFIQEQVPEISGVIPDPNACIYFSANTEVIQNEPSYGDYKEFGSYIPYPHIMIPSKLEIKVRFKQAPSTSYRYYIFSGDWYDDDPELSLGKDGVYFDDSVKLLWSEVNFAPTDCLEITLQKNGDMLVNGQTYSYPYGFGGICFMARYRSDSDGGLQIIYDTVPDGTELYYIRVWDENGKLAYVGYPDQAVNPATGVLEYCFHTNYCGAEKNIFAYYPKKGGVYKPFGGNF